MVTFRPLRVLGAIAVTLTSLLAAPSMAEVAREVVFVIDGTASMGGGYGRDYYGPGELDFDVVEYPPELFEAQLEAVAAAIQSYLPANGTYSVAVVNNTDGQRTFDQTTGEVSYQGPRVVVPLTLLTNEDVRREVIDAVRADMQDDVSPCPYYYNLDPLSCPAPSASPGWGLYLATEELTGASPAASKEVCIIGDLWGKGAPYLGGGTAVGMPPEAFSFTHAWASAVNNDYLDRLSIVNVYSGVTPRDGSGATRVGVRDEWVDQNYRPYVTGGGRLVYVADTNSLIDAVGPACLTDDVELAGIEVNQVVQDLKNQVRLTKDSRTWVRAYVRHEDAAGMPSDLWLDGYTLDGLPLGRLTSFFPALRARPDPFGQRSEAYGAHLFGLPREWLQHDGLHLFLKQVGGELICEEWAPTVDERDCSLTVDLVEGAQIQADYQIFQLGAADSKVTPGDGSRFLWEVLDMTPASALRGTYLPDVTLGSGWLPENPSFDDKKAYLQALWRLAQSIRAERCAAGECRLLIGFFRIPESRGGAIGSVGGDGVALIDVGRAQPYYRDATHEVGHALGLDHLPYCGAESSGPLYDPWPFTISGAFGQKVPMIGPVVEGPYDEMWGLDSNEMWTGSFSSEWAIRTPWEHADLMSYCDRPWISGLTYDWFLDDGFPSFADDPSPAPGAETSPHFILSGKVSDTGSLTLGPSYEGPRTSGAAAASTPGFDYAVVAYDAGGNAVASTTFGAGSAPSGLVDLGPASRTFHAFVPADPSVTELRYYGAYGALLATRTFTAPPTGTVTWPTDGAVLDAETTTFTWQATEPNSSWVWAMLELSPDGGQSWHLLAKDYEMRNTGVGSLDVLTAQLPGTDMGILRLTVSDGVTSSRSEVTGLTIPPHPPVVQLLAPADGGRLRSGHRVLQLRASAWDREDGDLGEAIVWTSDRDGALGSGESPTLFTRQLSTGVHILSASIADADGNTASESVAFEILPPSGVTTRAPDLTLSAYASGDFLPTTPNSYTFLVENLGTEASDGAIQLVVTLPAGLDYVDGIGSNWSCASTLDVVTCDWTGADLGPGASAELVAVDVALEPGLSGTDVIWVETRATVQHATDSNRSNNSKALRSGLRTGDYADLALGVEQQGAWLDGHTVTLEVFVDNVGQASAGANMQVVQTLPASVVILDAGGDGWACVVAGQTVTCDWVGDAIAAGTTAPPIFVDVLLDDASATAVAVDTALSAPLDADASNNDIVVTSDVYQVVDFGPDLRVGLWLEPEHYAGSQVALRHEIINDGEAMASDFTVTHTLPAEATYQTAFGLHWSCVESSPGLVSCDYTGPPVGTKERAPLLSVHAVLDHSATGTLSYAASASVAGDVKPANDSTTIARSVAPRPGADLTVHVVPSVAGAVAEGESFVLVATAANLGGVATIAGTIRLELTAVGVGALWEGFSGAGWTCTERSSLGRYACDYAAGPLAGGASLPPVTLTFRVGHVAPELLIRPEIASGDSVSTDYNDGPDLRIPLAPALDLPPIIVTRGSSNTYLEAQPANGAPWEQLVASDPLKPRMPSVSADGLRMAFVGADGIYASNIDGSQAVRLTNGTLDFWPDISPDGEVVVFSRNNGSQGIWAVNAGGGVLRQLYASTYQARYPSWLPDGSGVVFVNSPGSGYQLVRVDADGSNATTYALAMSNSANPSYLDVSPDGAELILRVTLNSEPGIWRLANDASATSPLVRVLADNGLLVHDGPRFSPDGQWIVAERGRFASERIVVLAPLDGSRIIPVRPGKWPAFNAGPRPTTVEDLFEATVGEPIEVDVVANATTTGERPLRVLGTDPAPRGGELSCPDAGGPCTYTSRGAFRGVDSFAVLVDDGARAASRAAVSVTVRAPRPELEIVSPRDGFGAPVPPGTVAVAAEMQLGFVPGAVHVLFAVDLARALSTVPLDCNGDGLAGQAADDVNNDGRAEMLDCYLYSLFSLSAQLSGRSNVQAGILLNDFDLAFDDTRRDASYVGNVRIVDMSPAPGVQVFTGVDTDDNSNGTADLIDAAASIFHDGSSVCSGGERGATSFTTTAPFACRTEGTTAYRDDELLAVANALFKAHAAVGARRVMYRLSAGGQLLSESDESPLWETIGSRVVMNAFSPTTWGCGPLPRDTLPPSHWRSTFLTGGRCQLVLQNPSDAIADIPTLDIFDVESAVVERSGDAPVTGTFSEARAFGATISTLVEGPNTITARLTLADGWVAEDSITVYGQSPSFNAPPLVADDLLMITPPDAASLDVLDNDRDPDFQELRVLSFTQGTDGSVSCTPAGACTYTPDGDFAGTDSFGYIVDDGAGGTAMATVHVQAAAGNQPPNAPIRVLIVDDTGAGSVGLLDGVTDPEGTEVHFVSADGAAHGQVDCTALGACSYAAGSDFVQTDLFAYTLADDDGQQARSFVFVSTPDALAPDLAISGVALSTFPVSDVGRWSITVAALSGAAPPGVLVRASLPPGITTARSADDDWVCFADVRQPARVECSSASTSAGVPPALVLEGTVAASAVSGTTALLAEVVAYADFSYDNNRVLIATEIVGTGVEPDAGPPPTDAGPEPGLDAGPDAGPEPGLDAGPDAGPNVDAGEPAADAGTPATDAGDPSTDAGDRPVDAGEPPPDSGPLPPADAGTPARVDAGSEPPPQGPPDGCGCKASGSSSKASALSGVAALVTLLGLAHRRRRGPQAGRAR